jgi:DNA-binding response OmpR family regulator
LLTSTIPAIATLLPMEATKVLVVEDDAATRRGLFELLTEAGYACTAVESFHEAEQIAQTGSPDLLITDIRLGGYNGLQLVVRFPDLPAIVMTGYADAVLERDAGNFGASYVRKPLKVNELLELVKTRLVNAKHVRGEEKSEESNGVG